MRKGRCDVCGRSGEKKQTRHPCGNLVCCMLSCVCGRIRRCGQICRKINGTMEICDEDERRSDTRNGKTCRMAEKNYKCIWCDKGLETCQGFVNDAHGCKTVEESSATSSGKTTFLEDMTCKGSFTWKDHAMVSEVCWVFYHKRG